MFKKAACGGSFLPFFISTMLYLAQDSRDGSKSVFSEAGNSFKLMASGKKYKNILYSSGPHSHHGRPLKGPETLYKLLGHIVK